MGVRFISKMKMRGAFALEPSAAAMVPQITDAARIGFKATQSDITRSMRLNGSNSCGVDIMLTHDAPAGVRFERHGRGAGYVSETAGLDVLLAKIQPRVCFFGHHHTRVDAEVEGVRCIGLNKVGMPGNLVAIDMEPGPGTRGWSLLGEFGGR